MKIFIIIAYIIHSVMNRMDRERVDVYDADSRRIILRPSNCVRLSVSA